MAKRQKVQRFSIQGWDVRHYRDGIWRTRNNKSHRMRVSNVCSCRKVSFYSLLRRLKCSHCGSLRNLHHRPCSVLMSCLQRHNIKCPSIALECQSYECAQSRHWNCGFFACSFAGVLLILAITHHPPIEVHQ